MRTERTSKSVTGKNAQAEEAAGLPLCSTKEDQVWDAKLQKLRAKWDERSLSYDDYNAQREAIETARLVELVSRARSRASEYLDALTIIVGSHGSKALRFLEAFTLSGDALFKKELAEHNTQESRRTLDAVLQSLSEVPPEWNYIDLRRFFLGKGEQAKDKYKFSGKGLFKNDPEWSETEVSAVCECLVDSLYGAVLRQQKVEALPEPEEPPPPPPSSADYEIVPAGSRSYERESEKPHGKPFDREFIGEIRMLLASRGL